MSQKVIIIFGPTSSGKTDLSLKIADHLLGKFNLASEIISADSRQVYKGMNIGTAKVSGDIQKRYKHHFLSIMPPSKQYSANQFGIEATTAINKITERGHVPIIVGGTGTYVMEVVGGNHLDKTEPIKSTIKSIMLMPEFYRKKLYRKIESNVDKMFADGLYTEVKTIISAHHSVPMQLGKTHGYREFVEYAKQQNKNVFRLNDTDLEKIKHRIKIDTKKYAMHQAGWLTKMTDYHVVKDSAEAITLVDKFLKD